MNWLLILAFRGTNYHGFQVQKNAQSVCAVLQDAMQAVLGQRPDVKGCSRTDTGVHARGFAVSFHCNTHLPPAKLPLALNAHLSADIRVQSARPVPEEFHARYSASGKEYCYTLLNADVDDPFWQGLYYRVCGELDENAMNAAAARLLGRQDFSAFCSAGAKEGSRVRHLQKLRVEREGLWLRMYAAADGFLYNMVRILAGTLLLAGQGKLGPEDAKAILEGKNRAAAGPTLPAKGLCLQRVFYPEEAFQEKGDAAR